MCATVFALCPIISLNANCGDEFSNVLGLGRQFPPLCVTVRAGYAAYYLKYVNNYFH